MIRRELLRALLCAGIPAGLKGADAPPAGDSSLTAWWQGTTAREDFRVGTLRDDGISLPARAHEVLRDDGADNLAYAISRRPGEWLWKLDVGRRAVVRSLALDDSRRFEGHGLLWKAAGANARRALLTTQTDTDSGHGIVALHDDADLQVIAEWRTAGIGPHQICHWPTAGKLIVANGGILTLPETGREDRSEGPLQSSLAALDPGTGQVDKVWEAPLPGVSLRHLSLSDDGVLAVAMQQLPEPPGGGDSPVLALLPTPASRLELASPGNADPRRWMGYAGSVAARRNFFAVTCPRAGLVAIWASNGTLAAEVAIPGAWGITTNASGWWVTNSAGDLYFIDADGFRASLARKVPGRHWDNHMAA